MKLGFTFAAIERKTISPLSAVDLDETIAVVRLIFLKVW